MQKREKLSQNGEQKTSVTPNVLSDRHLHVTVTLVFTENVLLCCDSKALLLHQYFATTNNVETLAGVGGASTIEKVGWCAVLFTTKLADSGCSASKA